MTTARHAAQRPANRHRRRRLLREEILAGLVLVVALLVTVLLLCLQWLDGVSPSVALFTRLVPTLNPTHGGLT